MFRVLTSFPGRSESLVAVVNGLFGDTLEDRDEIENAHDILEALANAGKAARRWLEKHEWPERQQEIYDEEVSREAE